MKKIGENNEMEEMGLVAPIPVLWLNSWAPGRFENSFKSLIFKLIMQNCSLGTRFKMAVWYIYHRISLIVIQC